MVELRTRNREMTGCGGNHHQKLGHKRIPCDSQWTIPNPAGSTPYPADKNTNTTSSKPNLASRTPDSSYPLVSCIIFPSSSPFSLSRPQLYHHRTTLRYVITPYLSISWSWVNAEYSLQRVQHSPKVHHTPRVQHTPRVHPTPRVHHSSRVQHWPRLLVPPVIVGRPFNLMITCWPLNVASASGAPPFMITSQLSVRAQR